MPEFKKLVPTRVPTPEDDTRKRIRLLYVEDEDLNWEVTLLALRARYDIVRARNSEEAFKELKRGSFHAILMDIQLSQSELDGIGITNVLRGKTKVIPPSAEGLPPQMKSVPIIFMTAYSARYSRAELLSHGGDELVTKPIDFTHLGLCLSRCLLKGVKVG